MRKTGSNIELPPLGCAGYIVNYMNKIGFPMASEGYVKHSEIKIWCETQGLELNPAEHQLIFDSFIEYNGSKSRYEAQRTEPAPFTTKTTEQLSDTKQAGISAVMQRMMGNGN